MIKIVPPSKIDVEIERIKRKTSFSFDSSEEARVKAIIEDVREFKDKALIKYTKKFDGINMKKEDIIVSPKEIEEAYNTVKGKFREALKVAIANITAYHERQKVDQWFETFPNDVVMGLRSLPIERVGMYVPGGTSAYPSTVVMNAIPAKIAKVSEIIMVTPPRKERKRIKVNPYILVAAAELGINKIYKVGGAPAIAALAFGTETIPMVDKIVGPGNIYVTLAKKLVFGIVGIDKLSGPSELLIIADEEAEPEFIAADLLSQAEHDPNSTVILVTTSNKIALKVQDEIAKQLKRILRKEIVKDVLKEGAAIFIVESLKAAVNIANEIAPEHIELIVSSPQNILEDIKNAPAVFLGPHSPVAVGDYIAGPNHVLPTGGTGRFDSPLSVYDFVKRQSVVGYTKPALREVQDKIRILAEVEGLDAHARAVDVRFE